MAGRELPVGARTADRELTRNTTNTRNTREARKTWHDARGQVRRE